MLPASGIGEAAWAGGGSPRALPTAHPAVARGQRWQRDGHWSLAATAGGGRDPCASPGAGDSSGSPQAPGTDQEWGWPGRGCSALLATSGVTRIWQLREITHILVLGGGGCGVVNPLGSPGSHSSCPPSRLGFLGFGGSNSSPHMRSLILLVWTGGVCPGAHHGPAWTPPALAPAASSGASCTHPGPSAGVASHGGQMPMVC